eukprot:SAG31_NODE_37348_length_305_cov_0.679612_2_plen_37_part_01
MTYRLSCQDEARQHAQQNVIVLTEEEALITEGTIGRP